MDDVSRELGISKKTLYKYVSDKKQLVREVLKREMNKIEEMFCCVKDARKNAITELIDMNRVVHDMIKSYNPSTVYDMKKYYPEMFNKFGEERHRSMFAWILTNLKKGKKEGLYRKELNEEIIAKLYVTRIEGMHSDSGSNFHELLSGKYYTEILEYHIRGISNEKGIKEFERKYKTLKS